MGKYFDEIHASYQTELRQLPCNISDSLEVTDAKPAANSYSGYMELGKALSRQLRYCEATEAFSDALGEKPNDLDALRLRAGRYLSTLQAEKAVKDFERHLSLGGDVLDIRYRLGLCDYYVGNYADAMQHFEACLPLADEEMGIAVIYWHTLCAYRREMPAALLSAYHTGMDIGHHFAYEKAVRVFAGACSAENILSELAGEPEDLHFAITAYGLSQYLGRGGRHDDGREWMRQVLTRDSFWPCYAFLAAWNDENRGG